VIARGLTELSSGDLERVKGLKSGEIAEMLPDATGREVIHRDSLVVL
jgi:glutamate 5-kinase